MARVMVRKAEYDYSTLRSGVFDVLEATGGHRIGNGSRVVLKPNLLAPASPDRAVLTHPMIVRAVAEYAVERGGKVQVSDSPAMGTFEKVLRESGIRQALDGLDVDFREFRDSVTLDAGQPFMKLELARDALEADVLINLPKLKTHGQMLLTLGVKNLFGCVVGLRKPQWHLRTGVDRQMFAALLVHIYQAVRPGITILDGILAMEGQGPGKGGTPRHLGVLMGSEDATALDSTVCRMMGLRPEDLPTNAAAKRMGILADSVEVIGELPRVHDFVLPEAGALVFGPSFAHGLMRRHLVQRPVVDDGLCRLCGECWRYCPAKAVSQEGRKVRFDYERCIRCYCCLEVCPHGALRAEKPLAGRMFDRVIRRVR